MAAVSFPSTAMLPEMSIASIVVRGPTSPAPTIDSGATAWPFSYRRNSSAETTAGSPEAPVAETKTRISGKRERSIWVIWS